MESKFEVFLCDLRKENNLTQKGLAELIHVSPSTISKWEKGIARPSVTMYEDLAKALNISSLELFYCRRDVGSSAPLCRDELTNAIKEPIQVDKKRRHKVLIQRIAVCALAVLLLISLFFNGYLYYSLPPRMNIVDEFYGDAPEHLPYEKVYRIMVDYDGRITYEDARDYLEQIRGMYNMCFSDADAVVLTYYSRYKGRDFMNDYRALAVMLPDE